MSHMPRLNPAIPQEILNALGLHRNHRSAEAIELLKTYVAQHPKSYEGWDALGCILAESERTLDALKAFKQCIALNPEQPLAHYRYGLQCQRVNDIKSALAHFNQALKLKPDMLEVYLDMCSVLLDQHQHAMTEKILAVALKFHPFQPLLMSTQATCLLEQGRRDEAIRTCQEALIHNPDHIWLFCQLANISTPAPDEPLVARFEKLYSASDTEPEERTNLAFALARLYDKAGKHEEAFRYYTDGNRMYAEKTPYRKEETQQQFAAIRTAFAQDTEPRNTSAAEPNPIFILGMPRSGTTLAEQILDSHSMVQGAGELSHLRVIAEAGTFKLTGQTFPASIAKLDQTGEKAYAQLADQYLAQLRMSAQGAAFVCDKMPHNFLYVGLIHKLFPGAKIIHCRRNPMDTCFSIFTRHFAGVHPYAHSQESLAHYYKLYDELMQHWDSMYPGFIHTLTYETLVENSESEIRKLLKYCGLPWEETCLKFHENSRVVQTASVNQVRTPLYTSSVGKWKKYAEQLTPLKEALEYSD